MLTGLLIALWLGILTSISPCPLATNIAAISFIGRKVNSPRNVLLSGFLYTLGRLLVYFVLSAFIVSSLLAIPDVSNFFQKYMHKILGPLLIIIGMVLLELIKMDFGGKGFGDNLQKNVEKMGIWGALFLGVIFALAFCPVSAALFFGSLIPLAIKYQSTFLLPALYGIGTALPVILFAFVLAFATNRVGKIFNKITELEVWARKTTGVLFIIIGIYFCLVYIFKVI